MNHWSMIRTLWTSVMVIALSSAERLLRQFSVPLEMISLPSCPRKNEYSHSKQVLNFLLTGFYVFQAFWSWFPGSERRRPDKCFWILACQDRPDRKRLKDLVATDLYYHQSNHCIGVQYKDILFLFGHFPRQDLNIRFFYLTNKISHH